MRYLSMLTLIASLHPSPSFACGICIEDKVAATYDHQIVMSATARNHVVVFGQVEGNADMRKVMVDVAAAARRTAGVDRGSVRTSSAPPAFSFSLDPKSQSPERAVELLQRRVRASGSQLSILRIVTRDSLKPARASN
jgi:hypothetical protein